MTNPMLCYAMLCYAIVNSNGWSRTCSPGASRGKQRLPGRSSRDASYVSRDDYLGFQDSKVKCGDDDLGVQNSKVIPNCRMSLGMTILDSKIARSNLGMTILDSKIAKSSRIVVCLSGYVIEDCGSGASPDPWE